MTALSFCFMLHYCPSLVSSNLEVGVALLLNVIKVESLETESWL